MLEQELQEGLRPVVAPGELWERVVRRTSGSAAGLPPGQPAGTPAADREVRRTWLLAGITVVALVVAMGWSLRPAVDGRASVREWVKTNAGLDLAFAERAGLRFVAAHTSRNAAEVGFTVDGREGRLVMTKTDTPASGVPHLLPAANARAYNWAAGGLSFSLECASPEDLRAACSLCHG